MTSITRTSLLAGLACTVAIASGCGSDSSSSDSGKVTKTTTTAAKRVSAVGVGVKAPGLIAFRRYTDSTQAQGAVFTIKPDGTGEKQVTHPPTNDIDDQPTFSADGSKIAFARCPTQDPKPRAAWVVDREGSGAAPMEVECPRPDCDISDPAWSEDGRVALIVASGEVKQGPDGNQIDQSEVVVFDPKRGTQRRSRSSTASREISRARRGRRMALRSSTSASGRPWPSTGASRCSSSPRRDMARRGGSHPRHLRRAIIRSGRRTASGSPSARTPTWRTERAPRN
jgi:TolB protein